MQIKEKIEFDDDYSDLIALPPEIIEEDTVENDSVFHKHKKHIFAVVLLSMGLIYFGVNNIRSTPVEVENAIMIEDSNWSEIANTSRIESYFTSLSYGGQYDFLDAMSSNGVSAVHNSVKSNLNSSQHVYDEGYGKAYIMQKIGSFVKLNKVIGKQGDKIRVSVNCPSEADIMEFYYENSNILCRFFTNHDPTQENIVMEILNLYDSYEISTSERIFELPVKESDGVLCIEDDTEILKYLEVSYYQSMNQVIEQIKMHR